MQGSPRHVTGQWGHHLAALVAASGLLPALQAAQWPAPGSCSMLDGASSIYPLRQIETIAILKPRAQTSRGSSSPAGLLRELVMHIAGDRRQVAVGGPMIWGQNNPLGWIRPFALLLQLSGAYLRCHWTNSDLPSSEPDGWVPDVLCCALPSHCSPKTLRELEWLLATSTRCPSMSFHVFSSTITTAMQWGRHRGVRSADTIRAPEHCQITSKTL